ncbi:MAG: thiamine-phosphate kinase [Deltaproteobacteria bacterium]|nr:thiamine-phosphate kinase [Sandaracinaceae bacterium]MCX7807565.1 thiamine-phosphate kinase [Deltaproteobacteria bacterium]MDW8246648.1 thiamine-phosphate kinase [Sandaracinaceae bacterium]
MKEADWIEFFCKRFGHCSHPALEKGVGDDAALIRIGEEMWAISIDAQVEGVHFRLDWIDPYALGIRAVRAASSDLPAVGARAAFVLLSYEVPPSLVEKIGELTEGAAQACEELGAVVAGGNLSRGPALAIHTVVLGPVEGRPLLRSAAKAGDRIWVTGRVGEAALGLEALLRGERLPLFQPFIERWRRLVNRKEEGLAIAKFAHAAIDLSDGLGKDLSRILEASGVGATIELDRLPLAPNAHAAAQKLGLDAIELAINGGEDHELLFTAPKEIDWSAIATPIGWIEEEPGLFALRDGKKNAITPRGFDHFSKDG